MCPTSNSEYDRELDFRMGQRQHDLLIPSRWRASGSLIELKTILRLSPYLKTRLWVNKIKISAKKYSQQVKQGPKKGKRDKELKLCCTTCPTTTTSPCGKVVNAPFTTFPHSNWELQTCIVARLFVILPDETRNKCRRVISPPGSSG